jgi:toxin ParE1/3/4
MHVRWLERASRDLQSVVGYIAEHNAVAAQKLKDDIERQVLALENFPYLFRPGRLPGTREIVVHPNYIVVYRVGLQTVDILRVMHSRRRYP